MGKQYTFKTTLLTGVIEDYLDSLPKHLRSHEIRELLLIGMQVSGVISDAGSPCRLQMYRRINTEVPQKYTISDDNTPQTSSEGNTFVVVPERVTPKTNEGETKTPQKHDENLTKETRELVVETTNVIPPPPVVEPDIDLDFFPVLDVSNDKDMAKSLEDKLNNFKF